MLEERVQFMKCLADETRLAVVLLLRREQELCVCDLVQSLGVSQPLASRHLALLRQGDIVRARRDGKWMHYRLSDDLAPWQQGILDALAEAGDSVPEGAVARSHCAA